MRLGLAGAGITEESSYLEVFIGERRSYSPPASRRRAAISKWLLDRAMYSGV